MFGFPSASAWEKKLRTARRRRQSWHLLMTIRDIQTGKVAQRHSG
jgi:hypothetical protein